MNNQFVLESVLREDFIGFIRKSFQTVFPGVRYLPNWHIEAIAYQLLRCQRREINRLIITVPPRHLKSLTVSVAFVAWLLGHNPSLKVICASYGQDLANKLSLDTRTILEAPWYQRIFPNTRLHPDKNTQSEFMTTRRGGRYSTSVGGALTGRGGNAIIIDDPHKPDEVLSEVRREAVHQWKRQTLLSRLDSKVDDMMILVQQRLHEDDLAGRLLAEGGWEHLNLTAIAEEEQIILLGSGRVKVRQVGDILHPEREPLAVLDQLKESMGSYVFAAQYQQRPVPLEGGLLKGDWFKRYDEPSLPKDAIYTIQSWDTASKADAIHDYSVCTTWRVYQGCYYLMHVLRERLEFPALKKRIVAMAEAWDADMVLMEDTGAGTSLIQDLRRESNLNIVPITPKDDKATRLMGVTPMIEAGKVWIPEEAPWMADLLHELMLFPHSRHDDQVDSLSQFLHWANERPGLGVNAPICIVSNRSAVDSPGSPWYSGEDEWREEYPIDIE